MGDLGFKLEVIGSKGCFLPFFRASERDFKGFSMSKTSPSNQNPLAGIEYFTKLTKRTQPYPTIFTDFCCTLRLKRDAKKDPQTAVAQEPKKVGEAAAAKPAV